jgi:hypothetical protein
VRRPPACAEDAYSNRVEELSEEVEQLRDRLESNANECIAWRHEADRLSADLLATRRALKTAQAKGLRNLSTLVRHVPMVSGSQKRAMRLLDHYAAKFEREAGEM